MGDRITLVEQLLQRHPLKVKELLLDYCRDEDLCDHLWQYLGRNTSNGYHAVQTAPARLDTTYKSHKPTNARSQHPGSSGTRRTLPRQIFPSAEYPASPPGSASVASHSSLGETSGRERILLLPCNDDGKELPVLSRNAPVKQNLVSDSVVYGRAQNAVQDLPQEIIVHVPMVSGPIPVKVGSAANLTWRHRWEYKTNVGTFYVVPSKYMDIDVIFGSEVHVNSPSAIDLIGEDYQDAFATQPGHDHGFVVEDPDAKMQAPAPASAAPINRYHQPNVFGLSVIPDNARPQYDQVENLRVRQRAVVEEAEAMPDRPSATTAPSLRPTHGAHEQPRHVARPSASSLHDADENAKFGHIRISGNWDRTPISLTLDLDAPGEKFYQAFHQLAARRHRIVERHRTTLWLKSSKDMPEEEAYELRLSEEELEEGWEAAVEWMHENKREKAPHIYVTVEVGPG